MKHLLLLATVLLVGCAPLMERHADTPQPEMDPEERYTTGLPEEKPQERHSLRIEELNGHTYVVNTGWDSPVFHDPDCKCGKGGR